MILSVSAANRLGFIILGLTNNFSYVIMLSAALDLLGQISGNKLSITATDDPSGDQAAAESYCLEHSTSTILIADTLPSLLTKLAYPFLLVGLPVASKATMSATLSAMSFIITGLSNTKVLLFTGVVCASLSSGLGETTYLSNTPIYGRSALSGWSMGTGAAGLLGSVAYASLKIFLSVKLIMLMMLIVPVAMLIAYFFIITPEKISTSLANHSQHQPQDTTDESLTSNPESPLTAPVNQTYGSIRRTDDSAALDPFNSNSSPRNTLTGDSSSLGLLSLTDKLRFIPSLSKYFVPLFLVYFAEYFINQGLFELIYFPEITFLTHAAQYRWFQVSYQLGVMISRSTLDLFSIRNIWVMSLLQAVNAAIFLAHAAKLFHIPSFWLVVAIIVYEGLLGGFTYVNGFNRIKEEVDPDKREFSMSTVCIFDSLGIVCAGVAAIPTHDALCKLYA